MRHVGRVHRVDLDWLFERVRKDPQIQIRYIKTKQQMADIFTKSTFSAQAWTELRKLVRIRLTKHKPTAVTSKNDLCMNE